MSSNEQDYWSGVVVVACDKHDVQSFLMVGINNNYHIQYSRLFSRGKFLQMHDGVTFRR